MSIHLAEPYRAGASARLTAMLATTLLLSVGCGNTPTSSTDSMGSGMLPPAAPSPVAPLPCPSQDPVQGVTIYYVAINEPGANNDRCDGRSPVDAGNGHCPFKDFMSPRTRGLLQNVASVRVEVRAGTYSLAGAGLTGLQVHGTGNSEAQRVVLTAYGDETVVFDGSQAVREVIRVSGQYTTVERVTFQNSRGYNLEVRGGHHHRIQCNRFLANVSSDSLKGDGGAELTEVRYNEFTQWDSQAIDITDVHQWTIEGNDFHHPLASDGVALVAKFGTRDVLITRNRFHDTRGITLGGVSGAHANLYEAYNLVAEHNTFDNVTGAVVEFYSCSNCAFSDNVVNNADAGIILGGEQYDGPSGCADGCRATRGAAVARNRIRGLRGDQEGRPNTFWGVYPAELAGLSAGGNVYCTPPGSEAQFWYEGRYMGFSAWTRTVGTDSTSTVSSTDRGPCLGW